MAQGDAEKVQLPEARLKRTVVHPVPDSIKEIILEYMSEDDLNNPDRWRIPENKRNYWEMWQSYLKSDVSGAFYNAVWTGNIRLVREMLYHHGDFMRSNGFADIAVARTQNIEMVRMLLDAGFIFTGDDRRVRWDSEWLDRRKLYTALAIFAGQNDDPAVIQLLIDRGAELTDFAVYQAASNGKCENLRMLLRAGGNARARENDSHKNTALHAAAENGNAEYVALLLDYGAAEDIEAVETWRGWTPLLWAAHSGSDESVVLLLNAGANPEAVGKYGALALREAVQAGSERSVQLLLNSSAVNTINMISENSPLNAVMEAARKGHAGILRMLIEKGGDVNMDSGKIQTLQDPNHMYHFTDIYTNGLTALMLAGTPECVKILLQSGADVNSQDSDGRNVLLFKCYFSSGDEIVSLLINAGSYLYLDRDGGRSLLRFAADNINRERNEKAIALLKAAGCKDGDPNAQAEYSFYSYYAN